MTDQHIYTNRLRKGAEYLRSLEERFPHKTLRMTTWGRRASEQFGECGFAGCAAGHFLYSKIFEKEGLVAWSMVSTNSDRRPSYGPEYKHSTGYLALSMFFGLPPHLAHHIFDPSRYTGALDASIIKPSVVAQRMEQVACLMESGVDLHQTWSWRD